MMDEHEPGQARRWLLLALVIALADQVTKWLVLATLDPFETVVLVPNVNLTLLFNEGAAFSFLSDAGGWQRWLFTALALAVSGVLTVWLLRLRRSERWLALGLALLLGGAVGNLIDRMLLGHVVDFIQIYVPVIPLALFNPWPAFNLADSAITVGVMLLLSVSLRAE
ncbi:signal peptidase II [Chromatium okenii]|uniref:signal peptidase II n=1 Tax=Chromatium okenii TaxID=61644 RepID=UPI001F5C09F6|nr:signal peptidase II [Chromatium okenii]